MKKVKVNERARARQGARNLVMMMLLIQRKWRECQVKVALKKAKARNTTQGHHMYPWMLLFSCTHRVKERQSQGGHLHLHWICLIFVLG